MGFFDKIKGAVNAVTGGAAKVELELLTLNAMPGEKVKVRIKATSTGAKVESKGVFVDLHGMEQIRLKRGAAANLNEDVSVQKTTLEQEIPLAPAFVLEPNESKVFEGEVIIPMTAQPSFAGAFASHEWKLRGRIEAFGNDPDSGFMAIKVGAKPN